MSEKDYSTAMSVRNLSKSYQKDDGIECSLFWALENVSFDVRKGEILGIIGRNGSGKSTLFKIISKITGPTSGEIEYDGRLTSIIEIGTGFHADLSGKENVYLSAQILGYSTKEIETVYSNIVAFSGLDEFMNLPVKHYSSGMYLRLAFSIAFHSKIDILLLDEVLAVGDAAFRRKCYDKIRELRTMGTSIVFISHQMEPIIEFCDRCLWLDNGEVISIGIPIDIVERYLLSTNSTGEMAVRSSEYETNRKTDFSVRNISKLKSEELEVTEINVLSNEGLNQSTFRTNDDILIRLKCTKFSSQNSFEVSFFLTNMSGVVVFIDSLSMRESYNVKDLSSGEYGIECVIPRKLLTRGVYALGVIIGKNNEFSMEERDVCKMKVLPFENAVWENQQSSIIRPHLEWKFERI